MPYGRPKERKDAMYYSQVLPPGGGLGLKYYMKKYDGKWASLNNGFDLTAYEVLQRASNVVNDEPANSSLSKVDSSLFNALDSFEENVPVPQSAEQPATTPITLDLASPDNSNINVDEQTFGEVLLKSYFPRKDHHISSVVENGVTLWKATGDEKCTSVQSHVQDSTVMTIGIKSGDDLEAKFFEKNGGVWKNVDKRYFEHRLHSMKDFSAHAGERLGGPETLPEEVLTKENEDLPEVGTLKVESPVESNDELNFASLGCPLGGYSGSGIPVEDLKPVVEKVEPQDDKDLLEAPVEELGELEALPEATVLEPEEDAETQGERITTNGSPDENDGILSVVDMDDLDSVASGDGDKIGKGNMEYELDDSVAGEEEEDDIEKGQKNFRSTLPPATESSSKTNANREASVPKPTTPVTLDLSKPDKDKVEIKQGAEEGFNMKNYTPKDAKVTSVVDGGATLWTASREEKLTSAGSSTKGNESILYLEIDNGNSVKTLKFFEKVGTEWKSIKEDEFSTKFKAMVESVLPT
ncbi:hypothetical protein BEWA_013000 [Theileria equi strain WA]|uniref:Uncharacterized protein n=1 Tax=Theileria equi strain WA TaxID=1537102 RepID=L1LBN3_THEEQ|nr:hypothetical protein BEWA_013000 [Theileria equi strain WA]EKX72741.1 hypothetical protein BEWA_013000 [Theileria equi strain WA]|eukprot:XP_004832193.1 hypothetical protein BEWA_013000 [Theileria equi strain WA]